MRGGEVPCVCVCELPGFSVTAPWAFNWFLDGNENKVDISIVGTNGNFFLIDAHGVLRRMGAVTEIPGSLRSFDNELLFLCYGVPFDVTT